VSSAGTSSGGQNDGVGVIGGLGTPAGAGSGSGPVQGDSLTFTLLPDNAAVSGAFSTVEVLAEDLQWPTKIALAENDAYVVLMTEGLGRLPKGGGAFEALVTEGVDDAVVADGSIYWEQSDDIWQARSDTFSNPHSLFTQGTPALAISGQRLFVVPYDTLGISSLAAIDLQTKAAELVAGPLGQAAHIVANAHYVFASFSVQEESQGLIFVHGVAKAWAIPDWTETTLFPTSGAAMVPNEDYLYTNGGGYAGVIRFPAGAAGIGQGEIVSRDVGGAIGVDDENVYILTQGPLPCDAGGTLSAVPKSGGQPRILVTDLFCPRALAVDQSGIYWLELTNGVNGPTPTGRLSAIRRVASGDAGALQADAG